MRLRPPDRVVRVSAADGGALMGKRGPRPRPASELRIDRIPVRVTPEERAEIERRAAEAGETVSEYLRRRGLGKRAQPLP